MPTDLVRIEMTTAVAAELHDLIAEALQPELPASRPVRPHKLPASMSLRYCPACTILGPDLQDGHTLAEVFGSGWKVCPGTVEVHVYEWAGPEPAGQ